MQEYLYSAQYLLKTLLFLNARKVNLQVLSKGGRELNHFVNRREHPIRNIYRSILDFTEFVKKNNFLTSNEYVCVSTTFEASSGIYKAFIGLDLEIDDEVLVYMVVQNLANMLHKHIDLFKTTNSYHLFIPDLIFDNDLDYLKYLFDIVSTASTFIGDYWVSEYNELIKAANNYKAMQEVFIKILENVGHYKEKRINTLFDLRHIAHGVLEYERNRDLVYKKDGIRTQLFFRITSKNSGGDIPYHIKRFACIGS
ncbi:MAG: hypothetical protein ACD_24C00030G0001 [uncultured bacterium]|nr:MAG: hypothetical protein ACD_24C00030G0001 [uncultured bacterium]